MSETFRGEYYQKVDSKARVLIPAVFRRVLESGDVRTPESPRTRIVIVYGGKARKYCDCYSFERSEEIAREIAEFPQGSAQRLKLERNLVTLSATIEIDDDGRIVLPPPVREKLGLAPEMIRDGVEVTLSGTLDRFSLWRADTYRIVHGLDDGEEDDEDPLTTLGRAKGA